MLVYAVSHTAQLQPKIFVTWAVRYRQISSHPNQHFMPPIVPSSGSTGFNRQSTKIGRLFGLSIANIAIFRPEQRNKWEGGVAGPMSAQGSMHGKNCFDQVIVA